MMIHILSKTKWKKKEKQDIEMQLECILGITYFYLFFQHDKVKLFCISIYNYTNANTKADNVVFFSFFKHTNYVVPELKFFLCNYIQNDYQVKLNNV
jgi:hypothetical protein